jgi:isochorismate synthase
MSRTSPIEEAHFVCRLPGESKARVYREATSEDAADARLVYRGFQQPGIELPVRQTDEYIQELTEQHSLSVAPIGRCMGREEYLKTVSSLVDSFKASGSLEKVVFSRVHREHRSPSYRPHDHFEALCAQFPEQAVHWIRWKGVGEWIGSSPELLLKKVDDRFETVALAGTLHSDQEEWGVKEQQEQASVAHFIEGELKRAGVDVESDGPREIKAGPVRHLKTRYLFESPLKADRFLNLLHPTPAVCGHPREEALDRLLKYETYERKFYTGYWGIEAEQSQYFVNLRCLSVHDRQLMFYAGGGLNRLSDPEKEWRETEEKMKATMSFLHETENG